MGADDFNEILRRYGAPNLATATDSDTDFNETRALTEELRGLPEKANAFDASVLEKGVPLTTRDSTLGPEFSAELQPYANSLDMNPHRKRQTEILNRLAEKYGQGGAPGLARRTVDLPSDKGVEVDPNNYTSFVHPESGNIFRVPNAQKSTLRKGLDPVKDGIQAIFRLISGGPEGAAAEIGIQAGRDLAAKYGTEDMKRAATSDIPMDENEPGLSMPEILQRKRFNLNIQKNGTVAQQGGAAIENAAGFAKVMIPGSAQFSRSVGNAAEDYASAQRVADRTAARRVLAETPTVNGMKSVAPGALKATRAEVDAVAKNVPNLTGVSDMAPEHAFRQFFSEMEENWPDVLDDMGIVPKHKDDPNQKKQTAYEQVMEVASDPEWWGILAEYQGEVYDHLMRHSKTFEEKLDVARKLAPFKVGEKLAHQENANREAFSKTVMEAAAQAAADPGAPIAPGASPVAAPAPTAPTPPQAPAGAPPVVSTTAPAAPVVTAPTAPSAPAPVVPAAPAPKPVAVPGYPPGFDFDAALIDANNRANDAMHPEDFEKAEADRKKLLAAIAIRDGAAAAPPARKPGHIRISSTEPPPPPAPPVPGSQTVAGPDGKPIVIPPFPTQEGEEPAPPAAKTPVTPAIPPPAKLPFTPPAPTAPAVTPVAERKPMTMADLKAGLSTFLPPEHADAVAALYREHAAALGETPNGYVAKRLSKVGVEQGADEKRRGVINFAEDGMAAIRFFSAQKADVVTAVHETAHLFRRDLEGADLATLEKWAGVGEDGHWNVEAEEKFARSFEAYVKSGVSPTPELKTIFEKFKAWVASLYNAARAAKLVDPSPEVRAVMDRMLGAKTESRQDVATPVGTETKPDKSALIPTRGPDGKAVWTAKPVETPAPAKPPVAVKPPEPAKTPVEVKPTAPAVTPVAARTPDKPTLTALSNASPEDMATAQGLAGRLKELLAKKKAAAEADKKANPSTLADENEDLDDEIVRVAQQLGRIYHRGGAKTFAAWAKALHQDIGEDVKPFLASVYTGLKRAPGMVRSEFDSEDTVDAVDLDAILKAGGAENGSQRAGVQQDVVGPAEGPKAEGVRAPEVAGRSGEDGQGVRGAGDADVPVRAGVGAEAQPGHGQLPGQRQEAHDEQLGGARGGDGAAIGDGERGGRGGQFSGADPAPPAHADQPTPAPKVEHDNPTAPAIGIDYTIEAEDHVGDGGPIGKAKGNLAAIRVLKTLKAENRLATREEQAILVKYVGWGATDLAQNMFRHWGSWEQDKTWPALAAELKELLGDDWAKARHSTLNAHYTSPAMVKAMWDAVERMGFKGGRILEPGSGVGHFYGLMPKGLRAQSSFTGVELDPTTAAIAKALYPNANFVNQGFQDYKIPDGFFDLAIGNPPFDSSQKLEHGTREYNLHDYFFAKSIDKLRPGGVMALITSNGTMDKVSDQLRDMLVKKADILGAIRLPRTAFKKNAGTEVVTDVIFIQKREAGAAPKSQSWSQSAALRIDHPYSGGEWNVNEYYHAHPEMVLGLHSMAGKMYRSDSYTVLPRPIMADRRPLEQQFDAAAKNLPADIYKPRDLKIDDVHTQQVEYDPKLVRDRSYNLDKSGNPTWAAGGVVEPVKKRAPGVEGGKTAEEIEVIKSYIPLRNAARAALAAQRGGSETPEWKKAVKDLNAVYDKFVEKHGLLNKSTSYFRTDKETGEKTEYDKSPNLKAFKEDADAYSILSLEKYDRDSGKATKADIFKELVVAKPEPKKITNVIDAMNHSLGTTGKVDLSKIMAMVPEIKTEKEAIDALGDLIYKSHETGLWESREEYLSGSVREKLKFAREAAKIDKSLERNVTALEAVQPVDKAPDQIKAKLGSTWIPMDTLNQFAREELRLTLKKEGISYDEKANKWEVNADKGAYSTWNSTYKVVKKDGTKVVRNLHASEALQKALSQTKKLIWTYRMGDDGELVKTLDIEATTAVNDKISELSKTFKEWAFKDPERTKVLVGAFNDRLNPFMGREFDGAHLTLPGISSKYDPRKHQKDAVWRILQTGNTYMAHGVGAGKTLAASMAAMELRRLGLANKPMIGVPNHMLKQFASEFLQAYPTANVLIADEENFSAAERKTFAGRVANGNWDAVIMTHSALNKVPVSPKFEAAQMQTVIDDTEAMLKAEKADGGTALSIKRMEKALNALRRRQSELLNRVKDDGVSFEDMGIDFMLIDEAHIFRKLDYPTRMAAKGIASSGSKRSWDLFMKTQYLETQRPGRHTVLMSGTPITNTIGEAYTIQRYLQPRVLEQMGVRNFDAWAAVFGEIVSNVEADPAGELLKPVQRFASFTNMGVLSRAVGQVMDLVRVKDLPEVERPTLLTGDRQIVGAPKSKELIEYNKLLNARIEAIKARKGRPQKGDDILLKVITDGRHASADIRFVVKDANPDPTNKLNTMIRAAYKTWKDTSDLEYTNKETGLVEPRKGATQIIFSDLGTEAALEKRGFSSYTWIRDELVRMGVPASEIAFVQDYSDSNDKLDLFRQMNSGEKRFLIGSSGAMGTGMNVQHRLIALHHLDTPWYPADVEQREGRIWRQGNKNKTIQMFAYTTIGSFDVNMWQMLETKQKFIDAFLSGKGDVDEIGDIGDADQYALAKAYATGDPRMMERASLEAEIAKDSTLQRAWETESRELRRQVTDVLPEELKKAKDDLASVEKKAAIAAKAKAESGGEFSAEVFDRKTGKLVKHSTMTEAGKALIETVEGYNKTPEYMAKGLEGTIIGKVGGFGLSLQVYAVNKTMMRSDGSPSRMSPDVIVVGPDGKAILPVYGQSQVDFGIGFDLAPPSPIGTMSKLMNIIGKLGPTETALKNQASVVERKLKDFSEKLGGGFKYAEKLKKARDRYEEINKQLAEEGKLIQQQAAAAEEDDDEPAGTDDSDDDSLDDSTHNEPRQIAQDFKAAENQELSDSTADEEPAAPSFFDRMKAGATSTKAVLPWLKGKAEAAADAAGVTYEPELRKHEGSEPALNVADDWHATTKRVSSLGGYAEAIIRHVMHPLSNRAESEAMGEYLVAKDELSRAEEGKKIEGDRTSEDAQADMDAAAAKLDPAKLAKVEELYKAADRRLGDLLVEMGKLNPSALRDDHVYHIVLARKNGAQMRLGVPQGARQAKPGSANKAKGSAGAIERDPFRALYQQIVEVERSHAFEQFKDGVVEKHSENAAARDALDAGGVADVDLGGKALYSFGPNGPQIETDGHRIRDILGAVKAGEKVSEDGSRYRSQERKDDDGKTVMKTVTYEVVKKDAEGNEHREPLEVTKPDYFSVKVEAEDPFVHDGRQWYLMDAGLSKGLATAAEQTKETGLQKMMRQAAHVTRYLTWVIRPLSQVKQFLGDPLVAMSGVPIHYWPKLWKNLSQHMGRALWEQYVVEGVKGESSSYLQRLRLEGIAESTFYKQGETHAEGGAGHYIPESVLPWKNRSTMGKVTGAIGKVVGAPEHLAIRETAIRAGLAETYMELGASRKVANISANEIMTDYGKKSPVGKVLAPITQFTKFVYEQALRLTINAFRHPLTLKNEWSGILYSPYGMLATIAIACEAFNRRDDDREQFWENSVPERLRNELTILGDKQEDGSYEAYSIDTQLPIFWAMWSAAKEVGEGKLAPAAFGDSAKRAIRFGLGHLSAPVRAPIEFALDKRLDTGSPITPAGEKYMTPAQRREANAKRGGLPFFDAKAQYLAEQIGGFPIQALRMAGNPDAEGQDTARMFHGNLLSPFTEGKPPIPRFRVGPKDKANEEHFRDGDERLEALSVALEAHDAAAFKENIIWLANHGFTAAAIKAYLTRGRNEFAKQMALTVQQRQNLQRAKIPGRPIAPPEEENGD